MSRARKERKMAKTWKGEMELDIRDSTPDWTPYLAPQAPTGSPDPEMPGFAGTLTLYVDGDAVGSGEIVTQPGYFCPIGDGICVGRDSGSPVTPEYLAPFTFTGGRIAKVVVDVSGERYVDHEAQVRGWFAID
jgi:arylsulfatase